MTTLLLVTLFVGPLVVLAIALARASRGGVLTHRALAVATLGGRNLTDVITYTQDCSQAACLLLAHRTNADPALVRRILRDAVTQIDSVQRASRLRDALGRRGRWTRRRLASWPDVLLIAAGVLDAGVVARIIAWRGDHGMSDLTEMTRRAIERFSATVREADDVPLVSLFAEELVRLGLLDAEQLEPENDDPEDAVRDDDRAVRR